MKKRKKTKGLVEIPDRNPVAKFAHNFNKTQTFKDRSKYFRKAKHKNQEPLAMLLINNIANGFRFSLNGKLVSQRRVESYVFL